MRIILQSLWADFADGTLNFVSIFWIIYINSIYSHRMRIITKEPLRLYADKHPDCKTALQEWIAKVEDSQWNSFADVRQTFGDADMPGNQHYVFNIHGNHHRLVVVVKFFNHTILVRWIGTHAEYDKIKDVTTL